MFKITSLGVLFLFTFNSFCYPHSVDQNAGDSLTIKQIDSIIKTFKDATVGKKIRESTYTANYHYDKASNSYFLIAVYESKNESSTLYYYIKNELSKVIYLERRKEGKSIYYFSDGKLFHKEEKTGLKTQEINTLLLNSNNLKSKILSF